MSRTSDREYIINVAQQFLQNITGRPNPLTNFSWFAEVCGSRGHDAKCFYRNHAHLAQEFLKKFSGLKLQRLIIGSITPEEDPNFKGFNSSSIPRSSMRLLAGGEKVWDLFNCGGHEIMCRLAAVSLLAAAYDLCFCRHFRDGIRPI